jgi:prepilin-type N-terminal cleavage/methylation domain-containing protein
MFGLVKTRSQVISEGEGTINMPTTDMKKKRQRGFTLIEMLAVVVIISIVSGLGYVLVSNQIEKSRKNTDSANCRLILDAAQRYLTEYGPNSVGNIASNDGKKVDSDNDLIKKGFLQSGPTTPWSTSDKPEGYKIYIVATSPGTNGTIEVISDHTNETLAVGSY